MREVFMSYAWGGESEDIANSLEQTFQEKGIKLVRDKTDLGYRGLIKQFMQEIGRGKCVVVIISDRYLKSKNCMYELLEISRNGNFYERIFPIVLKDARIYNALERLNYITYWENEIQELNKGIKKVKVLANLQGITEEINLYTEIRKQIAGLVDTLQNMNTLTPEMHREGDFGEVIKAIKKRLDEDATSSQSASDNSQLSPQRDEFETEAEIFPKIHQVGEKLLIQYIVQNWDKLDPDLQDVFSLAFNSALREGKNIIETKHFLAASVRLRPEPLSEFFNRVPESALPTPIDEQITTEKLILSENPELSPCVEDSLRHLIQKASPQKKLSTADVFVDLAKNGTGTSVARLRASGVTPEKVDEIVEDLHWKVIKRGLNIEKDTNDTKKIEGKTKVMAVDLGIIVPLREEFRELFSQLPSPQAIKDNETGVTDFLFEWGQSLTYRCVATFVGDMGLEKAALATERFIKRCQPKTIVMLGIAGGINKDVKLGDVVVVTTANNYLHKGKAVPGEGETFTFERGGDYYRCSDDLARASQELEFSHNSLYQQWQNEAKARRETELSSIVLPTEFRREKPEVINGAIASGSVVGAAQEFTEWLKKGNRNYLALEMEGAGMLSAIYSHADPKKTLILRGISDFGDERKQELDSIGGGEIRRYAMNNAIQLLWKLLEAKVLPSQSPTQEDELTNSQDISGKIIFTLKNEQEVQQEKVQNP